MQTTAKSGITNHSRQLVPHATILNLFSRSKSLWRNQGVPKERRDKMGLVARGDTIETTKREGRGSNCPVV